MRSFAKLYYYYRLIPMRFARLLVFVTLVLLVVTNFENHRSIKLSLFLLIWFVIFEIFFRFKIGRLRPKTAAKDVKANWYDAYTIEALAIVTTYKHTGATVHKLLDYPQVRFLLEKADISVKDLQFLDIDEEKLIAYALSLVKDNGGDFVTTMDLIASYLLMTEPETKLLFNKNLKEKELIQILLWAKATFPFEEHPKNIRAHFFGEGIGEEWVFGWTIEAKKYMLDETPKILQSSQKLFGREEAYKELLESLYQNKSVILVGEPGVGKEALVEAFGLDSASGNVKGTLYHQRIFELMVDALLAGNQNQGDLEARIDNLIAEISHAGNVIIHIPDMERILGASAFQIDLSGVLIPYIEKGVLRVIGSMTPGAYEQFAAPRTSFVNTITTVRLEEPDQDSALGMLFVKTSALEKKYRTKISYRALVASLALGKTYTQGRVLPGACVTLLEDAANSSLLAGKKIVGENDVKALVTKKTNVPVGLPEKEEKDTLLHLETEIHKRLIDQEEAVHAVSEAMRRIRTETAKRTKPISFLFLGPTGVGKTETAKALASMYFGDETSMIRFDMSEYASEDSLKRLLGSLPGEPITKGELTEAVLEHPFSLVLLDEFEKAHPKILNLFLQVLDDGRLTDNSGKTVSFVDTIIIATSNAGSEFIRERVLKGITLDKAFTKQVLNFLQQKNLFRPELLNRFDDVVVFKPLGPNEAHAITKLFLDKLAKRFAEQDIAISFDESVIDKVATEGFDAEFGARPLNRYIQDTIEDAISQKILKNEIGRGSKVTISIEGNTIQLTSLKN